VTPVADLVRETRRDQHLPPSIDELTVHRIVAVLSEDRRNTNDNPDVDDVGVVSKAVVSAHVSG
jgi:hypothetical protein